MYELRRWKRRFATEQSGALIDRVDVLTADVHRLTLQRNEARIGNARGFRLSARSRCHRLTLCKRFCFADSVFFEVSSMSAFAIVNDAAVVDSVRLRYVTLCRHWFRSEREWAMTEQLLTPRTV